MQICMSGVMSIEHINAPSCWGSDAISLTFYLIKHLTDLLVWDKCLLMSQYSCCWAWKEMLALTRYSYFFHIHPISNPVHRPVWGLWPFHGVMFSVISKNPPIICPYAFRSLSPYLPNPSVLFTYMSVEFCSYRPVMRIILIKQRTL